MARTIDERVVEMRFDNAQFEKNVQTSLGTIDKLKVSLHGLTSKDLNLSKTSVSAGGAFGSLASSVSSISDRFSAMGIVGKTVLEEITKAALNAGKQLSGVVLDPLIQGGQRRAMNIEQAKFQLSGLGIEWEKIYGDLDYAVSGTAYGLDSAAKAASQLVASGIQVGTEMKAALRGISGVAAMTNREYDEIARIFTTVAGNGRLMGSELTRLGERGLNAAAAMAKAWGVTEEKVREMASEKEISAEMFFKAMDDAYGEHAKKANETYTGAMANYKAALGRIGADFHAPYMENMKNIYNALRPVINEVRNVLAPKDEKNSELIIGGIAKKYIDFSKRVTESTVKLLENKKTIEIVTTLVKSAENVLDGIVSVLAVLKKSFNNVFPKITLKQVADVVSKFEEFTKTLTLGEEHSKKLEKVVTALFTAIKKLGGFIRDTAIALSPLLDVVKKLASLLADFVLYLSDVILGERTLSDALKDDVPWFDSLSQVMQKVADTLVHWIDVAKDALISGEVFEEIASRVQAAMEYIKEYVEAGRKAINNFIDGLGIKDENGAISFALILERIRDVLYLFIGSMTYLGKKLWDTLEPVRESIAIFLEETTPEDWMQYSKAAGLMMVAYGIMSFIKTIAESVKSALSLPGALAGLFKGIRNALEEFSKIAMINSFTAAIISIAGAIAILALIPGEKLAKAVALLSILGLAYLALMKGLSKLVNSEKFDPETVKRVKDAAKAAALIGGAMFILTLSVLSMGKWLAKDGTNFAFALGGLFIILIGLTEVIAAMWALSKFTGDIESPIKISLLILTFGFLIGMITSFFKSFMTTDFEAVANAMMAMVGLAIILSTMIPTIYFLSKTDAKAVLSFAILLLSLRSVIKAVQMLANLPPEEYNRGMGALIAILGLMTVFSAIMNYVGGAPEGVSKLGQAILLMALAVNLMIIPVYALGNMPWEKALQGVGILATILLALGMVAVGLKGTDGLKGAGSIAIIAASLNLLILPLAAFAKIGENGLNALLMMASVLVTIFAAALLFGKSASTVLEGALAILAIGAAIGVAGLGLGAFALAAMIAAAAIVALSEAIKVVASTYISLFEHFGVLAVMSVVVGLLGASLVVLGFGLTTVGLGLITIGIGLGMMTLAVLGFSAAVAIGGVGLVALSIGLEMLNIAVRKLGGQARALFDVSLGLAAIAAASGFLGLNIIVLGAGLGVFAASAFAASGAILALTLSIWIFGSVFPRMMDQILQGFETVKIMILGIVDYILLALEKLVKFIPFYGDEWSQKIQNAREGVENLMKPSDLINRGPTIGDQIENVFGGLKEKISNFGRDIKNSVGDGIKDKLGDFNLPDFGESISAQLGNVNIDTGAFKNVLGGALSAATGDLDFTSLKDSLGGSITGAIGGLDMTQIQSSMGGMLDSSFADMEIPSDGISSNLNEMLSSVDVSSGANGLAQNIGTAFSETDTSGISSGMSDYVNNAIGDVDPKDGVNTMMSKVKTSISEYDLSSTGNDIIKSMFGGISDNSKEAEKAGAAITKAVSTGTTDESAKRAVKNSGIMIANEAVRGINSKEDAFVKSGRRSAQGYARGLRNSSRVAQNAGAALVKETKKAVDKTAKIHSPAKLFEESGYYSGKGYAVGLDHSRTEVADSGKDLVAVAKASMSTGLGTFSDLLSGTGDLTYEPVVRPVWDGNSLQNGINTLKSDIPVFGLNTSRYIDQSMNLDTNDLASILRDQNALLVDLGNGIRNMDLRLDSGQLVGGIAARMDSALGTRAIRAGRGNHA